MHEEGERRDERNRESERYNYGLSIIKFNARKCQMYNWKRNEQTKEAVGPFEPTVSSSHFGSLQQDSCSFSMNHFHPKNLHSGIMNCALVAWSISSPPVPECILQVNKLPSLIFLRQKFGWWTGVVSSVIQRFIRITRIHYRHSFFGMDDNPDPGLVTCKLLQGLFRVNEKKRERTGQRRRICESEVRSKRQVQPEQITSPFSLLLCSLSLSLSSLPPFFSVISLLVSIFHLVSGTVTDWM